MKVDLGKTSPPSFAGAVRAARDGDVERFAELVSSFQDMAVGYAFSILGDFQLAEDAAQEAFFDAYRHISSLREPLAFPRWLRRIVFKHCDRRTRKRTVPTIPLDGLAGERAAGASPSEIAERNEMRERLESALDQLPETKRSALVLHYIGGHTVTEIAAFLDLSAGTVKKRLHDGREKLREILLDEFADALRAERPSRDPDFAESVVEVLRSARAGDIDRVKALLARNPRLREGRDVMGNTALIIAVNSGHDELAALIREAGPPVGYHEAAAIGDTARVKALLEREPLLLDTFSDDGFTALGLAAHYGHVETTRFLLERGADVNVVFQHPIGTNALIAALFGRRVAVALTLVDHGAYADSKRRGKGGARSGWTALHYAAAFGLTEVVSALVERGADPEAGDGAGKTALDVAREEGQKETECLLIELGNPPNGGLG